VHTWNVHALIIAFMANSLHGHFIGFLFIIQTYDNLFQLYPYY